MDDWVVGDEIPAAQQNLPFHLVGDQHQPDFENEDRKTSLQLRNRK